MVRSRPKFFTAVFMGRNSHRRAPQGAAGHNDFSVFCGVLRRLTVFIHLKTGIVGGQKMSVVKSIKNTMTATLGLLALSLLLSGVSLGQIKSGVIIGTVTDASGAVVPGARVVVISQETNVTTSAVTDETGNFTVPYLA